MKGRRFPLALAALLTALPACDVLAPEAYEYIAGDYAGEGLGITDGIHVTAAFHLTIKQTAGSFSGEGTTEGVWTDDDGALPYTSEYVFEGTMDHSDPPQLEMWFNAGCVSNDYVGYVLPNGDIVLDGQALVTDSECQPTGEVLEVVIYLQRDG